MIRTKLISTISIVLFLSVTPALSQQALNEQEVKAAVDKFSMAFLKADVTVLKTLLCRNYIHVNGNSGNVLKRNDWLNWIVSRRAELESAVLVINDYKTEDVQIEIFGETAIVTGVVKANGQRKGTAFSSQIRFTNVWLMEDGTLRRAAFHDSNIP